MLCRNEEECEKSDLRRDLMQLVYPSLDPIQLDLENGSSGWYSILLY